VLVLERTDVEEAQRALRTIPLVKEGLIEFDLKSLKQYQGFASLFT
jgi:hypothetical protein